MEEISVSVVMAMFNEEKFLMEAIASVQKQSMERWELIIIDDHSDDRSFEIAVKAATGDPRLVVEKNSGKGKVAAFNLGVSLAKGKFVHLFAGDDILLPNCLERCLEHVTKIGRSAIYHELQRVDVKLRELPDTLCGGSLEEHSLDEAITKHSYAVPSGLWFFEKGAYSKAWPIPNHVPYEDVWVAVCFRSEGPVGYLPDRLYLYRQHANQTYGPAADDSLDRYKFRMKRLGDAFKAIVNDSDIRPKLHGGTVNFCEQQIEFAQLLCGDSRSLMKLFRSRLPWKRRISIATAWFAPGRWSALRRRALG